MAVAVPGLDVLPAGPHRTLVLALYELYRSAGKPSVRRLSATIRDRDDLRDTVSHETIGATLRGQVLPGWLKVECLVRQLAAEAVHHPDPDTEVRRILGLWLAASEGVDWVPSAFDDLQDHSGVETGARSTEQVVPALPSGTQSTSPARAHAATVSGSGNLPARNPYFTGRESHLEDLLATTPSRLGAPVVLCGLGGVGKTQIAIEYSYRSQAEHDLVWWVAAEDPVSVRASLAALGERLGLPAGIDMRHNARAVSSALEARRRWLLVFDNADQPKDLAPLLPASGGHIVVTSRNDEWSDIPNAVVIEVDVFERRESIELLQTRGHRIAEDEAELLADKLGDLPLAIEQVAAMQAVTRMPVARYLELFDNHFQELLSWGQPTQYPVTVAAFLRVALVQLRAEMPAAGQLFELFAFLGSERVSKVLLRSGRDAALSGPLSRALREPSLLDQAIARVRSYGLARVSHDGQHIQVHRVFQIVIRNWLSPEAQRRSLTNAQRLLAAANPGRPDDPRTWALHGEILPHIYQAELIDSGSLECHKVVVDQARYLYNIGDYDGSRQLGARALESWGGLGAVSELTADHRLTLLATRHLANALRALGDYEQSQRLTATAWEKLRASPAYGAHHEITLQIANSVGQDLRLAGDYARALEIASDNVERHQRSFGPRDQRTLVAENNLAVSLRFVGDFTRAYKIDEQLRRDRQEIYDSNDPLSLISAANLSSDLYGLGRYSEALRTQREAWPIMRRRLGPRHSTTVLAARNLVIALRKTGQYDEALVQAEANYDACHSLFGSDHESTLANTMSYVLCLLSTRNSELAASLATEAVASYERRFGERNPLTLAANVNRAIVLRAVGAWWEARQVDEVTLQDMRRILGRVHPHALAAANNLANDLRLEGEHSAAQALYDNTLTMSRRVRGDEHPDTLSCACNLAISLMEVGDIAAGRRLLAETVPVITARYGHGHAQSEQAADILALSQSFDPRSERSELWRAWRAECDIEPPPT